MAEKCDTRAAILQTALDLMWAESYGGVSVDDICKRSKTKKGSFYHFFESKAELGKAALELLWDGLKPELDQIFSPQVAPLDRIRGYAEASIKDQKELTKKLGYVVGCPFTSIGSEQCSCNDGLSAKSEEVFERVIVYLESAIKDAVDDGSIPALDAKDAAKRILTYELGALSYARIANSLDPLDGLYETWLAMLTRPAAKEKKRKAA